MPRTTQLPTPQSSSQLKAQDGLDAMEMEMLVVLPPAALCRARSESISSLSDTSEYQPPSPPNSKAIASKLSRKSSTKCAKGDQTSSPVATKQVTLPPPPSRTRKIIEMKPTSTSTSSKTKTQPPPEPPKKGSSTTRKISRKTAHSLIERRRRGKMNDEFDVLKEMIPACESAGREMHKLEILKASVDYIRYLKDCVSKLQGSSHTLSPPQPGCMEGEMDMDERDREEDDEDTDVEMSTPEQETAPAMASPSIDPELTSFTTFTPNPPPTPKLSPAILPRSSEASEASMDQRHHSISIFSATSPLTIPQPSSIQNQRNYSVSSGSDQRHYSFSSTHSHSHTLGLGSPPHKQLNAFSWQGSSTSSAHTSPLLAAQADQDATVALLMLNGEWPSRGHMGSRDEPKRVGSRDELLRMGSRDEPLGDRVESRRRGLSVKDLLSS